MLGAVPTPALAATAPSLGLAANLFAVEKDDPDGDTLLDNILIYAEHLGRHLGTIESIRALQGSAASTTR
jgi:hypothetical protein